MVKHSAECLAVSPGWSPDAPVQMNVLEWPSMRSLSFSPLHVPPFLSSCRPLSLPSFRSCFLLSFFLFFQVRFQFLLGPPALNSRATSVFAVFSKYSLYAPDSISDVFGPVRPPSFVQNCHLFSHSFLHRRLLHFLGRS